MTVQSFINLALRDIGRIQQGDTPSTDTSTEALNIANEILGSWSHEGLLVPTHALTAFAISAGTNSYTMGVGANWVTTALPVQIKGAISSVSGFQMGMEVLPMGKFEASIANSVGRTAALPSKLGVDNAAPLRNVRLFPTPNNSSTLVEVSYWMPITALVNLSDALAFALPAFELALRNELSLRLAAGVHFEVTTAFLANAQASKTALARVDPMEPADTRELAQQAQQQAQQPPR